MSKRLLVLSLSFLLLTTSQALAQKDGRPPAPVVTAKVSSGEVAPQSEFIGTVNFTEISDVAAEIGGKVGSVVVSDGQEVKEGDVLVELSSEILDAQINGAKAKLNQAASDFELARLNNTRIKALFKSESVAEGEYDQKRLGARSSQAAMAAARASLDQLNTEKGLKTIRAPYDGMILERHVDRGEWVSSGAAVITMSRAGEFDVVINAPESAMRAVKPGLEVSVKAGGGEYKGRVYAVIPKGDVATRTFPVKIRLNGVTGLAEGMAARVSLPSGAAGTTLVLPRDAVISNRGTLVVWAVLEGKAVPMPVTVVGYKGLVAGVSSKDLKEGMDVVVKGNERLQPGQPVAPAAN